MEQIFPFLTHVDLSAGDFDKSVEISFWKDPIEPRNPRVADLSFGPIVQIRMYPSDLKALRDVLNDLDIPEDTPLDLEPVPTVAQYNLGEDNLSMVIDGNQVILSAEDAYNLSYQIQDCLFSSRGWRRVEPETPGDN